MQQLIHFCVAWRGLTKSDYTVGVGHRHVSFPGFLLTAGQFTEIRRGFASSALGSVIVNTPSFISASILLWSILLDSEKLRR
jgi:hypothetical protein